MGRRIRQRRSRPGGAVASTSNALGVLGLGLVVPARPAAVRLVTASWPTVVSTCEPALSATDAVAERALVDLCTLDQMLGGV